MRCLSLLLACAATIALTAEAPAQTIPDKKTLRIVPHADLRNIDPIWTTAIITRNHGYMIYDTLFAADEKHAPEPQMVGEYKVSADSLTFDFTLRPGLKWHDGGEVTSADVIPSLERWMKRDTEAQGLVAVLAGLEATGKDSFRLRLKEPYGLVLTSLAKIASNVPFIMPERVAKTDAMKQIEDTTGSGPFIFDKAGWRPGHSATYTRFPGYVPRNEPASMLAGGKVAKVDRVEWLYLPDSSSQVAALNRGEIDLIEAPAIDLLPVMKANKDVKVGISDPLGMQVILRPNHLHPPFNNVKARQALYYLIDQAEYMRVMAGDPEYWTVCDSLFMCGTPSATSAGAEMINKPDIEKARALFKEAGYNGEPVVVLYPTDHPSGPAAQVTADRLKKAGVNVELQAMDWATLTTRRSSKNPPAQGGWNLFHTRTDAVSAMSPLANNPASSGCDRSWFGWACDPETEKLRLQWAREPDDAKRKQILETVQTRLYANGNFAVVGQYTMPSAYRANIDGLIKAPVLALWNVEKR
jgi:peptide/nickel transport system substrate-binding protein